MLEIHYVPPNAKLSRHSASLYIVEDNEAVIKLIFKGRSPTMRHVSRTHRVALDWLFYRINLDPMIQVKIVDTHDKFADILTKRSSSCDECETLLCLVNIMDVSFFSCFHFSSRLDDSETMSRRQMQEKEQGKETTRGVLKARPTRNLVASSLPGRSSQKHFMFCSFSRLARGDLLRFVPVQPNSPRGDLKRRSQTRNGRATLKTRSETGESNWALR